MKTLLFALFLAGCAHVRYASPVEQCRVDVCPKAAISEETSPGTKATYDDTDDTCICTFKDGRMYTTPRK
jgi:hypothetical protein